MAYINNVLIVRHKLLANLVRLWKNNNLIDGIDMVPIQWSPKRTSPKGRCCIHKERAVLKYKMLPLLGLDMSDEQNEAAPLSQYARQALERRERTKENIMCVIDEACSSCIQTNYEITSLCRGCVARSCQMNCPKNAIKFKKNGQAYIDHDLCINCGMCHKSCQYHAVVYIPVPCEESCPVKAISKDEYGVEHIDETKCIYCGKCMNACPFGAIFEISQTFDILNAIRRGEKLIAIPAPAILGQFNTEIEKVYTAFKQIGFSDVIEVAQGAMTTTETEAAELVEKLEQGQPFMTTSCCPSYIELVEKHIPAIKPYVSSTRSPMYYTAQMVRQQHPDAKIVFVGPCIAKRKEARRDPAVDYVLTFEELGAIFDAYDIDIKTLPDFQLPAHAKREAHSFAAAGGVTTAVKAYMQHKIDNIPTVQIAGLNKKNVILLNTYAKTKKAPGQFLEIMACDGGCITGPAVYTDITTGQRQLQKELLKQKESYETND